MEIRQKLKAGDVSIGSWMQIPSADVAEVMGKAGYDWVAVDLEHGAFSQDNLPDVFRALELGGTVPFARVAQASKKDIKCALDAGAKGIILPMIEMAEQLENALSWAYYPPKGTRGVGYCRANLFGKHFDQYLEASDEIICVAQIEHIDAVSNIDSMLSNKRLDAIMVGPYDLSGSMNLTGQFDHPTFNQVMETLSRKTREHNIPMGLHIVQPDTSVLKSRINDGYQFIAYGIDAVFLNNLAQRPVLK